MHDIVIIGGGPAGLTAGLYARRNGKSAVILEKAGFGGQIAYSPKVENYPGFYEISGSSLAEKMTEQVISQNVDVEIEYATTIEKTEEGFAVKTEDGNTFLGKAVIIATGVKHRMLGIPGEEELIGNGISFCAVCDGDFYRGKSVAVIGGGNSALQEALLLSDICQKVTVIQNLPTFTGEPALSEQLSKKANVQSIFSARVVDFTRADGALKEVVYETDGKEEKLPVDGAFVAIGLIPENEAFSALVKLNDYGYVESTEACLTNTDGIFVAGDCRTKSIRQVTTATADGATAALAACRYIDSLS